MMLKWWQRAGLTREQGIALEELAQKMALQGTPVDEMDLLAFVYGTSCMSEIKNLELKLPKNKSCIRIFFERWYIRIRSLLIYPWWKRCENACEFVWPYGFVVECGCPVHDPDEVP
jgi:hypothetical protein